MTDYVLTGLVKRRAELSGEIEATHAKLRTMVDNLESLDLTIGSLTPILGWRPSVPRRSGRLRIGPIEAR